MTFIIYKIWRWLFRDSKTRNLSKSGQIKVALIYAIYLGKPTVRDLYGTYFVKSKLTRKRNSSPKNLILVHFILSLNRKEIENGLMKQPWKGVLQVKLVAQIVIEFTDQFGNNWNKRKCSTRRVKWSERLPIIILFVTNRSTVSLTLCEREWKVFTPLPPLAIWHTKWRQLFGNSFRNQNIIVFFFFEVPIFPVK